MKHFLTKILHVRTALALLLTAVLTLTAQTARADSWPEYITDVVLVGGTSDEVTTAKAGLSGYIWCSTSLNDGTSGDIIYLGYKKGSQENVNGGYITDFIVIDSGNDHNPSTTITFQGKTYYRCPTSGNSYFATDNHGNLTSNCSGGWNMYLYYTKDNFDDKRAVNDITIYSVNDINTHKSGAINLYYLNGNLHESNISLNRGVKGTPYVYMHISTTPKVNRPSTAPVMASNLTYNGSAKPLITTGATLSNGTMYYRVGTSGSFTSTVSNVTATNAGTYTVYYYAGSNDYSNSSENYANSQTVTIAKSPNSGAYVTCSNYLEGTAPVPELKGTNLSSGTVTYKYSTSQNGTYTTTKPSAAGTYWVKATIAGDSNCYEYTTAATSFNIVYNWELHNSGDSEADAYIIYNKDQLNLLAERVNTGSGDDYAASGYSGKYFRLGANITYSNTSVWDNTTSTENNYTPIGNSNNKFKGHFDGKEYTVSGIRISASNYYNGLFGNLDGATVKNVILSDARIMSTAQYCGGIAGYCSSSTITNCWVKSNVCVGKNNYVGGIVGQIVTGTIMGCRSEAMLKDDSNNRERYGGIAGTVQGQANVKHCIVVGASVPNTNCHGAIAGRWIGNYTNNYYINCNVAGVADATNVGCEGSDRNGARKAVAINTADGVTITPTGTATTYTVSGITAYEGNNGIGFGGKLYAGEGETVNLDIAYNIEGFSITGYNDGSGNNLTNVSGTTYTLTMTADAPTVTPVGSDLWGVTTAGRDGTTAEKAYRITTPEGLNLLAKKVNGDGYTANNFSGKYFELGDDIAYDKTVENNFTPIGNGSNYFSGHFDGKGHTVSGININMKATDYKGLFGNIHSSDGSVEVKNLTLDNSKIVGKKYCGGIACYIFKGTISNCHVTSSVAIYGSYNWADYHGGIVGYINQSNIIGCTSSADVTITSNESGMKYYGGIAGIIYSSTSTIQDCLVYGGTISGREYVGAVVGKLDQGTLTNNRYSGTGRGRGTSSGDVAGATFACAVIPYDGVTIAISGTPTTQYDYDGLKVYPTGMSYGGMYYNDFEDDPFVDSGGVEITATYTGTVPEDYVLDGFGTTSLADNPDVSKVWDATGNTATFTLNTNQTRDYYIVPVFLYAIWGNGDGSQDNPYVITSVKGLNKLSSEVNAGADLSGKYFELGADIEYDGTEGNFTAIGTESNRFKANFDGKGHTISGINLNTGNDYQGIFGFVEYCYIQNLTVSSSTIHGGDCTGGILGRGYGVTVSNCHVTSDVTLYGDITVGGICGFGHYSSKIQGCTSAAKPTFRWNYYNGGIVGGMNKGILKDCLYLGPQFDTSRNGAILGYTVEEDDPTAITNCYHTAYGLGGFNGNDTDGARFAVSSTTKPAAITGDATATYGTGTYQGITAYQNGLLYNGRYYWHDDDLFVISNDGTTNTTAINAEVAQYSEHRNVVLAGRTLYKDGGWNTIYLPFTVTVANSVLEGATFHKLVNANIEGSTLNLEFGNATNVDDIISKNPYIIKWDKPADYDANPDKYDIKNPVFTDVNFYPNNNWNYDNGVSGDNRVRFIGTFDKVTFEDLDRSILFVGAENTLYYPDGSDVTTIGACRAYFKIGEDGAGARQITGFNFNFDGGETSGIITTDFTDRTDATWFTIDGKKLDKAPTRKGLYILNGKKVVIK